MRNGRLRSGPGRLRGELFSPGPPPRQPRRTGRSGERFRRSAEPAGNRGGAGGGAGAQDGRAGGRMEAWPGRVLGDREARPRRAVYCYIKVPGPIPPERKTTCVRPALGVGWGGAGRGGVVGCGRKARALIRPPLPHPRRKRGRALSCSRRGGGSGGSSPAGSGFSERPSRRRRPARTERRALEVAGSPSASLPALTGLPATPPLQFAFIVTRLFLALGNVG